MRCLIAAAGVSLGVACASRDAIAQGFDLRGAIAGAAPGERIVVPAGVYRGPIVVDRAVSLIGEPGAIIDAGGEGDAVRVTAEGVTLSHLIIRNTGTSLDRENAGIVVTAPRTTIEDNELLDVLFGVYLRDSDGSVVRRNRIGAKSLDIARRGDAIRLWRSSGCVVEDNEIDSGRDLVLWFSTGSQVRRNHVSNGRYGLHFMYSDDTLLEDNLLESNSVGIFMMYSKNLIARRNTCRGNRGPSGFGIGLKDVDGAVLEDNVLVRNRVGVHVDNSPSRADVRHRTTGNIIAFNDIGAAFMPSVSNNDFLRNSFLENVEHVAILGRGRLTGNAFSVDGVGNFWSDYAGFDLDGDGVGDLPYRSAALFEDLVSREPMLRFFLHSPAEHAIDVAARAFPIVEPVPKLIDDAPQMRPIDPRIGASADAPSGSLVGAATGLAALGATIIGVGLGGMGSGRRPGGSA